MPIVYLDKLPEFKRLFIMSLGAILVEYEGTYDTKIVGPKVFNPSEEQQKERELYIGGAYINAQAKKVDMTLQGVHPFVKVYFDIYLNTK